MESFTLKLYLNHFCKFSEQSKRCFELVNGMGTVVPKESKTLVLHNNGRTLTENDILATMVRSLFLTFIYLKKKKSSGSTPPASGLCERYRLPVGHRPTGHPLAFFTSLLSVPRQENTCYCCSSTDCIVFSFFFTG